MNVHLTPSPAATIWECFCDKAYYDLWAVRRTHERAWGQCFHMNSAEEARGLVDILNACERQTEDVQRAINILDGNEPTVDWKRGGDCELLRKLSEHLDSSP